MTGRTKLWMLGLLVGLVAVAWLVPIVVDRPAVAQSYWSDRPINATAAVADADVVVFTLSDISVFSIMNLEIENAGDTNALTDFKIQLTDHPDGEWYTYLGGADFSSTTISNLRFVSTAVPNTLAAAGFSHVHARLNGACGLRLLASCAAGTTVEVRGSLKQE